MAAKHEQANSGQDPESSESGVRERILAATERLCGAQPISKITIRGIAAEADVNPGLLHYYFSTKRELFGATLTRMSEDYLAAMDDLSEPGDVAGRLFDIVSERPGLPRLTAWLLLEQVNPFEVGSDPMAEYWFSLFGAGESSRAAPARAWNALMLAAAWGVYKDHPLLTEALATPEERDALVAEIRELLVRLARGTATRTAE